MNGYTSGKAHRDPEPWVHPRHGRASMPHTGTGWGREPRPEFGNHNPILVSYRASLGESPRYTIASRWVFALEFPTDGAWAYATKAEQNHARRVLEKLAALEAVVS